MTDVIFDDSDNHEVADTSKQTYQDLKESGELADQAQKVYEAIQAMPYPLSVSMSWLMRR